MAGWWRRLRARVRYRRFDAELRQEIDAHRAMLEQDLETNGRSRDDARVEAARTLGNATLGREQARRVWLAPWLESVWQDLWYATRTLLRTPAFTVTVLVTMAIGIAISTAQFSAFNTVILKPWPVEHHERLVILRAQTTNAYRDFAFTPSDVRLLEGRSRTLSVVGAMAVDFSRVSADPAAEASRIKLQFVTPGFFEATGIRFEMGRNIRPDENRAAAGERVAIISHALWQREFHGTHTVLGRTLYFGSNKVPFTVIGVTRQGWRGPLPHDFDAWLPLQSKFALSPKDPLVEPGGMGCCLSVIARLAPTASEAQAEDEATSLLRDVPAGDARDRRIAVSGTAMVDAAGRSPVVPLITLALMAGTFIALLLTGANVAHLQLARAMTRRKEIQTRLALGASRGRVVRQLVTEALLLSMVAGALSLVVVYNLRGLLMTLSEIGAPEAWALDTNVFLYCFGVAALTSLVFGLTPALRTTKVSLTLGAGHGATPGGRLRFNTALLSVQIALSVSVLTGASFMTRAVASAASASHIGFDADDVTLVLIARPESAGSDRIRAYAGPFIQQLSAAGLPPFALTDVPPFSGDRPITVKRDDAPLEGYAANIVPVSPSAFSLLDIPFVEGRPMSDRFEEGEAVVSQRLAQTLWPGEPPLGKRLTASGQLLDKAGNVFSVVGVTRDVHYGSESSQLPALYIPLTSPVTQSRYPYVLVRGAGPAIVDPISNILRSLDPSATLTARPLTDNLDTRLADYKMGTRLAWAGGALALALSAFGIFGIFAFVVEDRRREIGIRLALGATNRQILHVLFGTTRRATLAGLVIGLLVSLSIGPLMGSMRFLFGLSPFDPMTFAGVAGVLTLTGFLATFIPARRALAVDPAVTLKHDV